MDKVYRFLSKVVGISSDDRGSDVMMKSSRALIAAYAAIGTVKFLWKYLRPFPQLKTMYGGTWAVISGATGGIGLRIAHELAAHGVHIILMARNVQGLTATATDLRSKYGIETREISFDAESDIDVSRIEEDICDLPISLLFNNVGVHNEVPTSIEDMEGEEIKRIVTVNCIFQAKLASAVIPLMKKYITMKSSKARNPCIINVSSLTSRMAMPLLSVYAATKAFEEHFTTGLAAELLPSGIHVMCLRPGLTVSSMSGETVPSLFCPSAEDMAHACLHKIDCGELCVVPYAPHAFLDIINKFVPDRLTWSIVLKMHEEKREKLLKKQ